MSQNVGKTVAKISTFPWCQDLGYHVWRLSCAVICLQSVIAFQLWMWNPGVCGA